MDAYYSAKDVGSADRLEAILYPSPLLTVKTMPLPESMEYDELQRTSITTYTKHYYIGSERIASALGTMKNLGLLCEVVWPGDQSIITEMGTKTLEAGDALIADYLAFEKDLQLPEPYLYETYICGDLDHHPENYDAYWYHPDHLGSSNYITNLAGMVNQHMEYLPFGETLVEEHLNSYNSPYKFNAKEYDAETGWYYYGARYYNPKWGIWLGVDPLAEMYPSFSSYAYTLQNPINFIDPDGRASVGVNSPDNEYKFTWNEETQQYDEQQVSDLGGNDFDVIHYEGGENDGNIEISFNPATETPYTPERGGMIGERIAPGEWNTSWRGASGAATAGHYGELLPLPKLALGKYLGKLMGWGGKKAAQESVEQGSYIVYQALDKSKTVRYVGITSRGLTVRAAEHKAADAAKAGLRFIEMRGMQNLTKTQARIFEQRLINQFRLQKNGGLLLNKINSIAPSKWGQYGIKP